MSKNVEAALTGAALTPGLRRFLYATAGLTGAAILIVEILGAKMLSPFVGTSHFVWTAQITITLISLATGYYFGGWLVDRSPRLSRLYWCILIAAVYLAFSIIIVEPAAYFFLQFNLAVGALFTSATLFFVPLTLLAAVGPFLVRVLALSFQVIGTQVGVLSAVSTFGSVLGTLLIGYVLIPFLPNSVTMYATAGALAIICLLYFVLWEKAKAKPALALLAAFLLGGFGVRADLNRAHTRINELARVNSDFGMLQVVELKDGTKRFYLNDYLVQNSYDPRNRKSLALFTYMLHLLPRAYLTNISDLFCIGLGIGVAPMDFSREGVRVDVVEINERVIPLAQKFFDLDPSRMNVMIGDGRYVLNKTDKKYDVVLLDAFLGDSSPSHLMSKEAFESMARVLHPHGVLVINSFGDFTPGLDFFVTSLNKTLRSVFPTVIVHATGSGNVFFVASPAKNLTFHKPSLEDVHPDMRVDVDACLNAIMSVDLNRGMVLTDDYNPTEFFDAPTRERHRRNLANIFREL